MSESNEKDGEGSSSNDEFDFYIQFTKPLVLDLRSSEDKAIASAWVQKLEAEPQTEEEKKLRLDYLKLLLFVLQRGRLSGIFKKQPAPGSLQPFPQGFSMADMGNLIIDRDEVQSSGGGDSQSMPYTIELSSDLREFVAAQEIPNFGVQMYYAWSSQDAINKWSLFDEDKFSSYILDKIKQLKDGKSDDKTATKTKKPCDFSFSKNFTKSKVKSPEEIEKSQGRTYQTYLGLVGRMGGGSKDCDDDQDKYPRQEPRKSGSSKKCGAPRRCQIEVDEEYDNFLSGLSGHNSTQKRNCKCPVPQNRPDCDTNGKGVQPFEEPRNPRSMSSKSKPETGACNVWPGQGAGGNKRLNVPMDQCDYGTQFSPVITGQQRNMPSSRSISPIRNDSCATGGAFKDTNRTSSCTCPLPPCTCPCPRQPAQQSNQMEVLRAAVGPSPSVMQQCGRPNGARRIQRPVNLMAPPDPACLSGGESSAPSQAQLHCYNQQYQNSYPKAPAIKIQESSYADDECDKKPQEEDRRKQKIANLSKIIAKEAREEDELDDMFSCSYKGQQSTGSSRQNFECPQNFPSQGAPPPQPRGPSPNQGKMRQQQYQTDNNCFNFGAPPAQSAPPSSNQCYSGGFQQPMTNQCSYPTSPESKRKNKPNTETYIKSGACPSQNQSQYEDRSAWVTMQPSGGSDGRGSYPMAQQTDPCSNYKSQNMNRPKSQSGTCQHGGFPSSSSNSGRRPDLASVLQGIHNKTEAHREKCNASGNRRSQSGEPPAFQRGSQSRSVSPYSNQPSSHPSCQSSANKGQSQSTGKSRSDGEGMMPCQYAESSQNAPNSWAPPSTYCPPQGTRQPMNYDTSDNYRKEGPSSSGKGGVCNAMANPQSQLQLPGSCRSGKSSQGSSPSTCQKPPSQSCQGQSSSNYQKSTSSNYQRSSPSNYQWADPSVYQGPAPSACQGFQPQGSYQAPPSSTYQGLQSSTCQGPPPSTCQGPPPSTYQGPPSSTYQGPPSSTCQGPPSSTCQGPPASTYQRPPSSTCQGPPPSTCQGSSPSNFQEIPSAGCQLEDEDPCDDEDDVSCPESFDECPPGSSTSAEFLENAPCEDMGQQWPAPAPAPAPGPSTRRSPDMRGKDCGQNNQRQRGMITSTPLQAPFLADESSIPCPSPAPCNMDFQYEQAYGTYNIGPCQESNQEAQFYPIFGNTDNDCGQGGGQSQQGCGGFMEMQNDTMTTASTTTNRRRNMLAAPMPDEQFSLSQTLDQFNPCH